MMSRRKQRQPSVLPHLPKGAALPEVRVTNDNLMMPGQKALPPDWRSNESNQQLQQYVPGIDHGTSRRSTVGRQGIPWTDRQTKMQMESDSEPPPLFSATPKKISLRKRESKAQKNIYSMNSGIDPVTLLTTRLEIWRLAIKNLVNLFKRIVAVEIKTSRGLVNASKEIILPFENANGQFLENGAGGIQDVWASLRDYTMQHGILYHESAGYIEKAVIPSLRAIKSDIKTMTNAIEKDKSLKSTLIFDSRVEVDRQISRLDKVIQTVGRDPQNADQNTDPFLLNLGVIHAVRELCDHENTLHDNILNLQKETGLFEQKIIENVRYILLKLQEYRLKHKIETEDKIGMVTETFNQIEPTTEWNDFVKRNQFNLVLEDSAYKTENMVEYPNQDSKYCRAVKIGPLQLKTGVLKGWTEGVYILTPAGFIHGYKTPKHFQTNPVRPSFSIFVPSTNLEEYEGNEFELRGSEKRSSMGFGTRYTFRASNSRDSQEWTEALLHIIDQFRIVPLLDTTENGFSSVVKHRDLPPLPENTLPLLNERNRPAAIEASSSQMNAASSRSNQPSGYKERELPPPPKEQNQQTLGATTSKSGHGASASGTRDHGKNSTGPSNYGAATSRTNMNDANNTGTSGYLENDIGAGGDHENDTGTGGYHKNDTGTGGYRENDTGAGGYRENGTGTGGAYRDNNTDTDGYREDNTGTEGYREHNTGTHGYRENNTGTSGYGANDTRISDTNENDHGMSAMGTGGHSQDRGLLNDPGTPISPAPQRTFLHQDEFSNQPFDQRPVDEQRNIDLNQSDQVPSDELANSSWRDPDIEDYESASHHSKTADHFNDTAPTAMTGQGRYTSRLETTLQNPKGGASSL